MAQDLFEVELGLEISDGPSFLSVTGAPGGETYTDAALVGSIAVNVSTGDNYRKHTPGTGSDKWEQLIGEEALNNAVGSQAWREPVLVKDETLYGNLAAAEAAVNTNPYQIDGVVVSDGSRILFTNITGENANIFTVTGTPGSAATLVEDTKVNEEGDVVVINRGTYEDEIHEYNGTAWISTGTDTTLELGYIRSFIGKNAAGTEDPDYGTPQVVTQNVSLEAAIIELDTAVDSNDTDITNLQTSTGNIQTELDNTQTSAGSAILADGTFNGYTGTSYIDTATSMTNADELLDDEIQAVQNEVDAIETGLGAVIDTSGNYVAHTSSNYIDGNSDVTEDLLDLDQEIADLESEKVDRFGDTMEPGANIVFTSGGEVLGLPATPSGPTAAASKAYVDSLTTGLVWTNPVWYIDLTTDGLGGAQTKDLQTPANNTDTYWDTMEDSDMAIVASGTGVTWTAVGVTGNTDTTTGLNAGDVVRWDADTDNGGLDPSWEFVGHISDNSKFGDAETNGMGVPRTRWGLDIATSRAPGGSFLNFDNAIVSLIVQDWDGNASTTEYDAIWATCGGYGTFEVNTVTVLAQGSISDADYFDVYAAVYGPNITGSTNIDPTDAVDGGTKFYVWYDQTGSAVDPAPAGYAGGIKVDISGDTSAQDVAISTRDAINGYRPQLAGDNIGQSVFWSAAIGGSVDQVVITDQHAGRTTAAAEGSGTGFTFVRTTQGIHDEPDEGAAFFVANSDSFNFGNQYTFTNGDWVLFGGGQAVVAGVGLSQSGNVLNVNLGAGIVELPSDEVGVDVYNTGGLFTTNDGSTPSTLTGAQLAVRRDGNTITTSVNGIRVSQTILDEIDAIETSLGSMISAAGVYVPFSGTNYIDGNASVTEDLEDLDAQIKVNEDAIGTVNTTIGTLQTEVDNIEAAAGSAIDVNGNYVAFSGTNYIDGNSDMSEDLTDLDAQIKTNADDIATINLNNGDEANIRSFIGKGAAGVETPTYSSAVNITQNTDLESAIGELDAAIVDIQATAVQTGVSTATILDGVLTKDYQFAKWIVVAKQGSKVNSVEVDAVHDGDAGAGNATDADFNRFAKLRINGKIAGINVQVVINGSGLTQTMDLQVNANAATDFRSIRETVIALA